MKRNLNNFNRKSINFAQEDLFSRNQDRLFYLYMFLEDMQNSIMPIGGRRHTGNPFSVEVTPNEVQNKTKVNYLFPSEFHSFDRQFSPLERTISGFISECAYRLLISGTQYFEIIPVSEKSEMFNENNSRQVFMLSHIPGDVIRMGRYYYQLIPYNMWKIINKKVIILPASSVWKISMPRRLNHPIPVDRIIRGLLIAGGKNKTELKVLEENSEKFRNFDIPTYYRNADLFVAWLTQSWGWGIRSSLQRYSLEYYQIYRRIKSAYSLAIFREHIFQEMNFLLTRIGFEFQMTMTGLPSPTNLFELFEKLQNKEIAFEEGYKLTDIH